MPEYTRQQTQAMLIIDQLRHRERGRHATEVDTAPHPMKRRPRSTAEAIEWPVDFMHAAHRILVRSEHLTAARHIVRSLGPRWAAPPRATPVLRGLHALRLPHRVRVLDALDAVERGRRGHEGLGVGAAAPDHLVSIARWLTLDGAGGTCPACEPVPVEPPPGKSPADLRTPKQAADSAAGEGVRIVVIDTGIDRAAVNDPARSWLAGVDGADDTAVGTRNPLHVYAGHGTFIAGLIRTVAPKAQVEVFRDFDAGGMVWESTLTAKLVDVLTQGNPDIINLSAGVWSGQPTGPLAFQVFYDNVLRHRPGVVVVAAAGNDASHRPFWPAASRWCVGVGALSADGSRRADFSSYGGWVDAYAPGADLVNAFPTGFYEYKETPSLGTAQFVSGMARWSGTSFATPVVAGMIAARMSAHAENSVEAANFLLGSAPRLSGIGRILIPG